MSFDKVSAEAIFFIGVLIISISLVATLSKISQEIALGINERGDILEDALRTDFEIINDPLKIPLVSGSYIFYIKNTGNKRFIFTNSSITVLIDGQMVNFTSSSFYLDPGDTGEVRISKTLSSGYHTIKVILHNGKSESMIFKI